MANGCLCQTLFNGASPRGLSLLLFFLAEHIFGCAVDSLIALRPPRVSSGGGHVVIVNKERQRKKPCRLEQPITREWGESSPSLPPRLSFGQPTSGKHTKTSTQQAVRAYSWVSSSAPGSNGSNGSHCRCGKHLVTNLVEGPGPFTET